MRNRKVGNFVQTMRFPLGKPPHRWFIMDKSFVLARLLNRVLGLCRPLSEKFHGYSHQFQAAVP